MRAGNSIIGCLGRLAAAALALVVLGLLFLHAPSAGAGQTFHDDFTSYPDFASGEPTWESDSVAWEMRSGSLRCTSPLRSFALYAPAPFAGEQTIEVTLTVAGATASRWKIAGACIVADPRNYWHLALVESPDDDGRRHFVELVESYDGRWLAEGAPETKLTLIERTGADFAWQYDHPYRLRLTLNQERIEGVVSELSGEVVARIAYQLDNPKSVRAGQAGLDSGGFSARFDDFRVEVKTTVERPQPPAPPPVEVRSWPGLRSAATGFFRVEERDGRWWLFDPHGDAFYIIGTDHANYFVHWCEALGYAPYHRNVAEKYGSEAAWAESTVARLRAWGFNTVAANHSPSLRYQGLAHIDLLGLGQSFAALDDIAPQVHWTGFPNVFSPKWEEHCRKLARQRCTPDDPWLIGYFFDNELEWYGKSGRPWGLADEALKKPAQHTAKQALVELLRERYDDDVARFNRAWGADAPAFDALLAMQEVPADTEASRADKMAFARLVAERYFRGCAQAIREVDPNHLLLGSRFAGDAPDIWDIAGKYCDIVSVNCYRRVDLDTGVVAGFEPDLHRWHRAARRPLMITEWSFPALDSGLPCKHGAGQRFDTQEQRAAAWSIFQELLFRTPYLVGSNYFMWVDEPALGISSTFPEDSNYGLVNERDEAYALLTQTAARVNRMAYSLHSGRTPDLRVAAAFDGDQPRLRIENHGALAAAFTARIWVDGVASEQRLRIATGESHTLSLSAPQAPGGHFIRCVADPEGAVPDTERADNQATMLWYTPGLPWPEGWGRERYPLLVANPTDEDLTQALVRVPARGLPPHLRAWSPQAGHISSSYHAGAGTLVLVIPQLRANSVATVLLYPTAQDDEPRADAAGGGGFAIAPGRVGQREAAQLLWEGERIGWILPLVQQANGGDRWVQPTLDGATVEDAGDWLTVRAALSHPGAAGGIIGPHDRPQQTPAEGYAFSCAYLVSAASGRPWATARLLWLRSDDERAWECPHYYHYLLPDFEGEAVNPEVPSYYRAFAGWWDAQRELGIGVLPLGQDDFWMYFWKDERGGLHPDANRDVERRFTRGMVHDAPQPEIIVFVAQGESLREASLPIWRQARAERRLERMLLPVERL